MNKDIRIAIGLTNHRKTRRLILTCGEEAFRCLIRLWCKIAQDHPKGDHPMSEVDVELDAEWNGEPGQFAAAIVETGFFDRSDSGLVPHDWDDHQGYVVHAEERRKRAKYAAGMRWAQKNGASGTENHAHGNAPSPAPSPPPIGRGGNAASINPALWSNFTTKLRRIESERLAGGLDEDQADAAMESARLQFGFTPADVANWKESARRRR